MAIKSQCKIIKSVAKHGVMSQWDQIKYSYSTSLHIIFASINRQLRIVIFLL